MDPRSVVTIVLLESVCDADRPFFLHRWSQDWQLRGLARCREKWSLSARQPVLGSQLRWAVAHRSVARRFSLHRLLGPLEHRLLGS